MTEVQGGAMTPHHQCELDAIIAIVLVVLKATRDLDTALAVLRNRTIHGTAPLAPG